MRRHSWLLLLLLPLAATAAGPSVVKLEAEPFHRLVLESPVARVYRLELPAGKTTLPHRHDHDYVQVTLSDANVQDARVDHALLITQTLYPGHVRFFHGPVEHRIRNTEGFATYRAYTVEILKESSQPYTYPPTVESVHDYDVLPFAVEPEKTGVASLDRDTVRMTRYQIRPGESLAPRSPEGPALLIALTDVQLKEEASDEPAEELSYAAGEAQWFEGVGYTLTNTGKEPARFIVLEFK